MLDATLGAIIAGIFGTIAGFSLRSWFAVRDTPQLVIAVAFLTGMFLVGFGLL